MDEFEMKEEERRGRRVLCFEFRIWDLGFQMALSAVAMDDDRLGEECSAGCRSQPAGRRRSPEPQGEEAQAMLAGG